MIGSGESRSSLWKTRRYWSTCRQPWHMQAHGRSAARHRVQVDARFWENISQRECDDSFISPEISYKTSRYKKDQIISCMWFNLKCLSPLTLYYLYYNSKKNQITFIWKFYQKKSNLFLWNFIVQLFLVGLFLGHSIYNSIYICIIFKIKKQKQINRNLSFHL